jgi:hypothetical protein
MKAPIIASIFMALAGSIASAAELSVFRVCQDQRVIRTSDGAEAGRVEFIVVDPSDQHVVSTVISGGVVGDRLIAVPYTSLRFSGGNEITLTEITRERLVSAPVIERTQISASVIEPSIIQRTTTHFSARGDVGRERANVEGARPGEARPNAEANSNDPRARANAEAASRRDAEARSQAEAQKRSNANDPTSAEAAKRGVNDPNAATNATQQRQQRQQQQQQLQQQSEKAKTDAEAKRKEDAAQQPQNADENRKATKPNRDLNNRATPQADREHNDTARPQSEAQPGAERKGAADRNASEETPKGRKPAEENAESSKRPPKKLPEPSAEERSRNEQRNPQI